MINVLIYDMFIIVLQDKLNGVEGRLEAKLQGMEGRITDKVSLCLV